MVRNAYVLVARRSQQLVMNALIDKGGGFRRDWDELCVVAQKRKKDIEVQCRGGGVLE